MSIRFGNIGLVVAMAVGAGIAHFGTATMPLQIGALIDGRGLTPTQAGLFGFFEVGALALTMIVLARVIHLLSTKVISFAGVGLIVIAQFAMYAMSTSLFQLYLLSMIAGVGFGAVFAATIAAIAAAPNSDRVYSFGNAGAVLFIVMMMSLMPVAGKHFGAMGPFLALAGLSVLSAPGLLLFSAAKTQIRDVDVKNIFARPGVMALLVMWAGYSIGSSALWSFAERIGRHIHIESELLGLLLSAGTFCGLAGSGIAAFLSGLTGRLSSVLVGLVGTGISCLVIGFAGGPFVFGAGVVLYWVFYMYQYCNFLGVAARMDQEGRVGTLGGGFERFAFAVGASIGGVIVQYGSYSALGIIGFLGCVITIPLCAPSLQRSLKLGPLVSKVQDTVGEESLLY